MDTIKVEAKRIADDLHRQLMSGDLEKIGIDEIRAAIKRNGMSDDDRFEEMVTREIVSRVF